MLNKSTLPLSTVLNNWWALDDYDFILSTGDVITAHLEHRDVVRVRHIKNQTAATMFLTPDFLAQPITLVLTPETEID